MVTGEDACTFDNCVKSGNTAEQLLFTHMMGQARTREEKLKLLSETSYADFLTKVCGYDPQLIDYFQESTEALIPSAGDWVAPVPEQAMVHQAVGYARMHRRRATFACLASVGPGATNSNASSSERTSASERTTSSSLPGSGVCTAAARFA